MALFPGTEPTAPRPRIVVINDNTAFLELMQELLREEGGCEVAIVREWDEAYQYVKADQPDLVILDIRMSGEEGAGPFWSCCPSTRRPGQFR